MLTRVDVPPPAGTFTTRLLPVIRDEEISRCIHRRTLWITQSVASSVYRDLRPGPNAIAGPWPMP